MGQKNNHRARLVKPDDYDKPWRVIRLIGKYVKCRVCRPKPKQYHRARETRAWQQDYLIQ